MYRKTYVKIYEQILTQNITEIVSTYPEYKYYFGVVKGNAYGHGMHIVNSLIAGGVNYLAVATLEEAIAVREFNSDIPILCLEPIPIEFLNEVIQYNVSLTVDSLEYYLALNEAAPEKKINVHIKLDTGMNRIGIKDKRELEVLCRAKCHENVFIEGIYTHLATSGINDPYYGKQMANFRNMTENIDLSRIPIVHVGRSLILVHHEKPDFVNGVRLGICMYGFAQSLPEPTGFRKIKRNILIALKKVSPAILQNSLKLNTAYTLYSTIISVKKIKKGEMVGYGTSFSATEDMTVATVAIGYYDGMNSALGKVSVNGHDCPIIGELCMDMTHIKVPENTAVGDTVEIFGNKISVGAAARNAGTSAYRLLTGITSRVPRVYGNEEYYL